MLSLLYIWNVKMLHVNFHTHTPTPTHYHLTAVCRGLPEWAGTIRNIHPLTLILIFRHLLSTSSVYFDPQHPPSSLYMPNSHFSQPLSLSSLVDLLVWDPLLYTSYISSSSHHLLFARHAQTIAACFSVVPMLCHLFLVSLLAPYLHVNFQYIKIYNYCSCLLHKVNICTTKFHVIAFVYF